MKIQDLAIAHWRLKKWIDKLSHDKKRIAESSLKIIEQYLKKEGIEVDDPIGRKFEVGLNFKVIDFEEDKNNPNSPIYIETLKPTIYKGEEILEFGSVIVGYSINEEKPREEGVQNIDFPSSSEYYNNKYENRKIKDIKISKFVYVLLISILFIGLLTFGVIIKFSNNITILNQSILNSQIVQQGLEQKQQILESEIYELQTANSQFSEEISRLNKEIAVLPKDAWEIYIIIRGDTLNSILNKYSISEKNVRNLIVRINGIEDENIIFEGRKIFIPLIKERE